MMFMIGNAIIRTIYFTIMNMNHIITTIILTIIM